MEKFWCPISHFWVSHWLIKSFIRSHAVQANAIETQVQWHDAWQEYVRGNVVSASAAALIKTFLLHTMAASVPTGHRENDSDGEESEVDPDIPPLTLPSQSLSKLILPELQIPDVDPREEDASNTS